jgi:hypothetical protein
MGVEYRHYLVVNDPAWQPEADTASRVEAVLRSWGLAANPVEAVDLTGGRAKELPTATMAAEPGAGVGVVYAGVQGEAVARIAGHSHYGAADQDRYLMKIVLIVGRDYRIQQSSESIYFELVEPPKAAGRPSEANDDKEPFAFAYAASFPSENPTSPPVVRAHIEENAGANIGWTNYQGFWRGGLVIDFGKDLPAFVENKHLLPEARLVTELAEAFRGPLVEVGEFY